MTRTYGTYTLGHTEPTAMTPGRPTWYLTLEPDVRMRARRIFGRIGHTRTEQVTMTHTPEVCTDLTWFMDRYPLTPERPEDATALAEGAAAHARAREAVEQLRAGGPVALQLEHEPAKTPREYQLAAVQLLRATRRLILTDEVGLGKTFTGLLAVNHADARPALVVPPTHLPPRWVTELEEAFPTFTYDVAKKTAFPPKYAVEDLPDVLIVPYSKLEGWAYHLAGRIRTVIFDEVQDLRRGTVTVKGSAAARITQTADYVLGLTATPVHNYGGEIWNLYDILAPDVLGTREEFNREWVSTYVSQNAVVGDPAALGAHLREQGLMLGRTRKDVGRELPKTVKVPMVVDSDHKALADVAESVRALAERILSDTTSNQEKWQAGGEIDWQLRRATGVDKAPHVADVVRMLLDSEERVVLFGWHRDVYEIWLDRLADFNPRLYTGTESPKQKQAAIDAFTEELTQERDDQCRILIMSLRSGAGVDGLQKVCRVAVFGELDWSPQVHEQAIGRLRRDGMGDDPPVAYFLHSTEGSDPALLEVLQVKRQQAEPIVSPDGKLLGNATIDTGRARRLAETILGTAPRKAVA
ncbi:SNF2 domain-containing protein [Microcella alkaliphila]|uniref:SNF2 domain-containing protein n=1 Tax=Microcella alkaliphila TaxID=279828 RepID=A0A4Q7TGD0_9MICO|nr:DEAD/DEAH box helicase [Microcella alkaliphila]RZT59343.1 SNF2 domain-containing protein [Microcella alkaliphila]